MTGSKRYPSYYECVVQVLSTASEPLSVDALVAQVEECRPKTRGSRTAVVRAVNALYQAVPLDKFDLPKAALPDAYENDELDTAAREAREIPIRKSNTRHAQSPALVPAQDTLQEEVVRVGWLTQLLDGSTIRHSLERDEVRGGFITLDELEHAVLVPQFFQDLVPIERKISVELFGEETLDAEVTAARNLWSLELGPNFVQWLDRQGAMADDDLIISVENAAEARYALRLQPREARDEDAIDQRNRELAKAAEAIAVRIHSERVIIFTWDLVARLLGNGHYQQTPAPDDLHHVLHEYSRIHLVDGIGYEVEITPSRTATEANSAGRTRGRSLGVSTSGKHAPSRDNSFNLAGERGGKMQEFDWSKGMEEGEDTCAAYEEYLSAFAEANRPGAPYSHDDFHLLAAELESLVDLELEFGYLLPDQTQRKQDLAERLFIDPESLVDGSWDDDDDDAFGTDSPAFWN